MRDRLIALYEGKKLDIPAIEIVVKYIAFLKFLLSLV